MTDAQFRPGTGSQVARALPPGDQPAQVVHGGLGATKDTTNFPRG
jgi:hypothetical protein